MDGNGMNKPTEMEIEMSSDKVCEGEGKSEREKERKKISEEMYIVCRGAEPNTKLFNFYVNELRHLRAHCIHTHIHWKSSK